MILPVNYKSFRHIGTLEVTCNNRTYLESPRYRLVCSTMVGDALKSIHFSHIYTTNI